MQFTAENKEAPVGASFYLLLMRVILRIFYPRGAHFILTLIETIDSNKFEIQQNGKIGFCVSNVDDLQARLKDAGITVTEIVRHSWGSLFEFFDPDSNKIEVWSGYSDEWSEK